MNKNIKMTLSIDYKSLVSLLSSQTDYTKITLPAINFVNLIEDIKDEDIILSNNLFIDFE